jgi:hypothetical protein
MRWRAEISMNLGAAAQPWFSPEAEERFLDAFAEAARSEPGVQLARVLPRSPLSVQIGDPTRAIELAIEADTDHDAQRVADGIATGAGLRAGMGTLPAGVELGWFVMASVEPAIGD